MKRKWSISALMLALVGLFVIANAASVGATPPSQLTNKLLGRGTDLSDGTIPLQAGTDVVMAQITVLPGGSSGWHSHPGGAIIVLAQGELTRYRSLGSQCEATSFGAGQSFIERPGEIDQVVNSGTVPYVVYVTFPRVPIGGPSRIDEPDPGTCPGL